MFFFQYICWTIVVYIYLNNPLFSVLGGIGSIKLLYPFALLGLTLSLKRFFLFVKDCKNLIVLFGLMGMFHLIHCAFGASFDFFYSSVVAFFEIVIIPYWLSRYVIIAKKFSIYRMLYIIASFASIVTLICFLSPSVNLFVKFNMQVLSDFLNENDFRGFGISDSLTYAYGIIQGTILSMWFVKNENNKWFFIFIPFVIFSILVNARVGLLIPMLFVAYILVKKRSFKQFVWVGALILIIGWVILKVLEQGDEQTFRWISDFWNELSVFSEGDIKNSGTINTLLNEMIIWPESISQWLWGRGESLYLNSEQNSDVGFILQLNYGGVAYSLMLFLCVMFILKILHRSKENWIFILVVIVFLVGNFKGDFIPNSGGFRMLMLLGMVCMCNKREVNVVCNY